MKKVALRAVAWLMAVLIALSSMGPGVLVSAEEEKVLYITEEMIAGNDSYVITGEVWDRVVIAKEVEAGKIAFVDSVIKELVVESGSACKVEVENSKISKVEVMPPKLQVIDYNGIVKMLAEGMPASEVVERYQNYLAEKERLSKLEPTIVTKGESEIGSVAVAGSVKLKLAEGNVEEVKVNADGSAKRLVVGIEGYNGKVAVEQTEKKDGTYNLVNLNLKNSNLESLNMAGGQKSICYVEGSRTSNIAAVDISGSASAVMNVKAEEVKLNAEAENASLRVYSEVKNVVVEGNSTKVELASCAKVENAVVEGNDTKISGSGTLENATISGKDVSVSTSGTTVEGENHASSIMPAVTATPRPTATPKPTATPIPLPTATPVPSPLPTPDVTENFAWMETEDGGIAITAYLDKEAANVVIPAEIDGKPVTVLKEQSFLNLKNLETVVLPDTLELIEWGAFSYCTQLKSLHIPAGVTSLCSAESIEGASFFDCTALKEFTVDENNTVYTAVDGVLYTKNMKMLVCVPNAYEGVYEMPETVTYMAYNALWQCANITEIRIPAGLTEVRSFNTATPGTISAWIFSGCTSLEKIKVAEGHELWKSVDGVLYSVDGTRLEKLPAKAAGMTYTMPDEIKSLGSYALDDCNELETIVLSESIGVYTNIFSNCPSLKEILVAENNTLVQSVDGVLFSKNGERLIAVPPAYEVKDYVVPEGVTWIGNMAFEYCDRIETIVLPEGVTTIGAYAFSDAVNLKEINLPEGIKELPQFAFLRCKSLKELVVPNTVTKINKRAFDSCSGLIKLQIPASVMEIGEEIIKNYSGLTIYTLKGSYAEAYAKLYSIPVEYYEELPEVSPTPTPVPTLTPEEEAKFVWTENLDGEVTITGYTDNTVKDLIIPDTLDGKPVVGIGAEAFFRMNFETVVLPESLRDIGYSAFRYCQKLKSIHIPAGVRTFNTLEETRIADFALCYALEEITVDENNPYFTSVDGVLYTKDMTVLMSVPGAYEGRLEIPETVTTIGIYSLSMCNKITEIVIPKGLVTQLTTWGEFELEGAEISECYGLKNIIVAEDHPYLSAENGSLYNKDKTKLLKIAPKSIEDSYVFADTVTEIGSYTFRGCDALKSITIPAGMNMSQNFFSECAYLTEILVDENNPYLKSVDGVVYSKDGATLVAMPVGAGTGSFTVPEGVTTIGMQAFERCMLEEVILPETLTRIESFGFNQCMNLKGIHIPEKVSFVGLAAFQGCRNLEKLTLPKYLSVISGNAFYGVRITELEIPSSVTAIYNYAFANCNVLEKIVIPASVTTISAEAFKNANKKMVIVTEKGSAAEVFAVMNGFAVEYLETESASDIFEFTLDAADIITITGLKGTMSSLVIPAELAGYKVGYIADNAFRGNTELTEVVIEGGVIGKSAFASCSALTAVTIGGEVTEIQAGAFASIGALFKESTGTATGAAIVRGTTTIMINGDVAIAEDAFAGTLNKLVFYVTDKMKEFLEAIKEEHWEINRLQ